MQPSYEDLAELAKICAWHSRISERETAAGELWRLSTDYQSVVNAAISTSGGDTPPPSRARCRYGCSAG
jgi:hypothetical protein